jgi:hypothetical protein
MLFNELLFVLLEGESMVKKIEKMLRPKCNFKIIEFLYINT